MSAAALEACIAAGGVAIFPADTVYGLACDPENEAAVRRIYELKGRPPAKPAAVMFGSVDQLPPLGPRVGAAVAALLPGGVTLLVDNPEHRFPLACGPDPSTLGIRVPDAPAIRGLRRPLLQSSANLSGDADARRLDDIPRELRDAVDLVVDGGELPGTPSTVIDLRRYEETAEWAILRSGLVAAEVVAAALG